MNVSKLALSNLVSQQQILRGYLTITLHRQNLIHIGIYTTTRDEEKNKNFNNKKQTCTNSGTICYISYNGSITNEVLTSHIQESLQGVSNLGSSPDGVQTNTNSRTISEATQQKNKEHTQTNTRPHSFIPRERMYILVHLASRRSARTELIGDTIRRPIVLDGHNKHKHTHTHTRR